jgi:hypothetical protein
MTATVTLSPRSTGFDAAFDAAVAAGWPCFGAFDAVCFLLAAGMTAAAVEEMFIDCRRRIQ